MRKKPLEEPLFPKILHETLLSKNPACIKNHMNNILIYMTCADKEEAEKIANALLEKRLIACANIMAPHISLYRWEGKLENNAEVAVILKTQEALFEQVRQKICDLHSYDCPCIVALPISQGHDPFLQWIKEETG
jgi:periplasmic divalent cation tolerance protein